MTAEWIRMERDTLLNGIFAFSASATRTLKTFIRKRARSRRFLLLTLAAGAVLAPVDIAPAGGAQSLDAAPVAITDSALSPETVTIPVGGSVLWTNRGTSSHQVVANRGAFKTFRLAPSNSNRVSFALSGIFPYAVDGKIKGTVIVIAGSAIAPPSTSSTGSSTGQDNCGHPAIYHYDISVDVHTDDKNIYPQTPGMESSVIDWKASWLNASMSVERCHGNVTVLIPAGVWTTPGDPSHQLATEDSKTFDWTDTTQPTQELVPPCHFTNVSSFRAGMFLQGKLYRSVGSEFHFFAARILKAVAREPGHCDKHRRWVDNGLGNGYDERSPGYNPIKGLDFAFATIHVNLRNHTPNGMGFPLAELAAGKGFTFSTGELRTQGMSGSGHVATTQWASVSISPVHP